jgi:CRP/FNR family transcriptional regulator, anaerobic regulatory protein
MSSASLAEISTLADVLERNFESSAPIRKLVRNEILFEAGDIKTSLYRVETGALCVYATRPDLKIEVIEFALAGDLVGIGFLETHASSARATVETKVRCFALADMDRLIARDERAKARYDAAVRREFAFRRDSLVKASRERPVMRLAAFLIALSSRNREEGRDPTVIDDALDCTVIAQYLSMSVDLLALALVQLEMRGLVQPAPHRGLRLNDLVALEAIANGVNSAS